MWNKLLIVAILASMTSCGGYSQKKANTHSNAPDMHTAANSLDYAGVYTGTIPAADCPGIVVRLVIYSDGVYHLNMEYLERDTAIAEHGLYTVSDDLLVLQPSEKDAQPSYYKIEEGRLRMLNGAMQATAGPLSEKYTLKKNA